jgi:hypothetical protein
MQRKRRAFLTYRYTLDVLLRTSYKRKYAEDATQQDAIDFMTYCCEQGLGARTVYDKVVTVVHLPRVLMEGLKQRKEGKKVPTSRSHLWQHQRQSR